VRWGRRLRWAFLLTLGYLVVEVVTAFATNSLALLSDAGHMLTDVVGLGMALAAIHLADRGRRVGTRTFGLYRLEILAALLNALLLFGVALYVLYETAERLRYPADVLGLPMLVVAVIGLLVNVLSFVLLREGAKESLNVQGAYLEVLADALGSLGVIVGGAVLILTGWHWVDPVVGAGIGVFILPRAWKLAGQALRILLQAAPPDVDLEAMQRDLGDIEGVKEVHDLHAWTLTSDMEVASAHLLMDSTADAGRVLQQAQRLLRDRYHVAHATLQVETGDGSSCRELGW
jgi:cobalt-zinc-cadmium efflux system protein